MSAKKAASVKEMFAFNLLPPLSKEELVKIAKTKTFTVNASMVPLGVLAIFLLFVIVNMVIIEPVKAGWEKANNDVTSELSDPNSPIGEAKAINGELKIKTDFIAEPVKKNVDYTKVFQVAEEIFTDNTTGSEVTSYGRDDSGKFTVNAVSSSQKGPVEILERFQKNPLVDQPDLAQIGKTDGTEEYRFTISFLIKFNNENK